MKLEKIRRKEINLFFKYYKTDFPFCERRTYKDLLACLKEDKFCASFVYDGDERVGYICFWKMDEFVFIEHVAILPELRGKGYGSKLLKCLMDFCKCDIVLEVEPPFGETQKRRIKFYEKMGLVLTDYVYFQPSYHKTGGQIEMRIMTTNKNYNEKIFDEQTKEIKKVVYRQK